MFGFCGPHGVAAVSGRVGPLAIDAPCQIFSSCIATTPGGNANPRGEGRELLILAIIVGGKTSGIANSIVVKNNFSILLFYWVVTATSPRPS